MTFIQEISPQDATGELKEIYDTDLKNLGYVAGYTRAMSLHPEAIAAWRNLLGVVRAKMRLRRYELVTMAAAAALRCTY